MHVFTPERAEPIPEYLMDSMASMPSPAEIGVIPYKLKWEMTYRHKPKAKQFFAPSYMQFVEKKHFYFLSPFKIISIELI